MLEPTYPLRTARLDLRPYEPGDLVHVRDMHTREEVTRYLYWDVMADEQIQARLERKLGQVALHAEGDGICPVAVLRETGEVVGDAALGWVSEEHRTGEVGFVLKPEFQGRGLASEMAARMRREAHLVQNEWVKGEWCDELAYAMLADEWEARAMSRPS